MHDAGQSEPQIWVQLYQVGRTREHAFGPAAGHVERTPAPPRSHVVAKPAGAAAAYLGARRLLRPLVVMLWLSPVLVLARLVLRVMGRTEGDYLTLAFVALVVVTFFSVSVLALLHLLAGPKSERGGRMVLSLPTGHGLERVAAALGRPPPGEMALADLQDRLRGEGTVDGAGIVVRGRVDAGLATGQPVLSDRWAYAGHGAVMRLLEGHDFTVRSTAGAALVVRLDGCPLTTGPYRHDDLAMAPSREAVQAVLESADRWTMPVPNIDTAPMFVLRQGDVVQVMASHFEQAAGDALGPTPGAAGGPYRHEPGSTALAHSGVQAPLVIERVS